LWLQSSPDQTVRDKLKAFKRHLRYLFLFSVFRWISRYPVESIFRIKNLIVKLVPFFFEKELEKARENLPPEFASNSEEILRKLTNNQVLTLLEVFFYEKILEAYPDFIFVTGKEILDRAVAEHKGVIILSAHFGNWELIGYTLAKMGYPIYAVARPQAVNSMTRFMNSFRESRGVKVLMDKNLSSSLRLLKKGNFVGILSDLNARERGFRVEFFGRPASFYPTPIILAERSGAILVPTFIERHGKWKQWIRFEEPVAWNPRDTMCGKIRRYVERYENAFRRRPEQWAWFHDRFSLADLGRIG